MARCSKEAKERHKRTGLMKPTTTWRQELKRIHPAFVRFTIENKNE